MTTEPARGEPTATFEDETGIRIEVYDESTPYAYANLFHVRLRVVASYPGGEEPYERVLARMGVCEEDSERVKADMLADFESSALPYLFRPGFAGRLAEHRQRQKRKILPFRGAP